MDFEGVIESGFTSNHLMISIKPRYIGTMKILLQQFSIFSE